jgi:hypothetical protein
MKQILFVAAVLVLLMSSACAQATPTVDPAQIQASAVAAANTMVAMTQAAIPTATDIPPSPLPSPTELPSPTPEALATLDLSSFPTASAPTAASGGTGSDPCAPDAPYKPMDPGAAGPKIRNLDISNETNGSIILSLYLNKTPFGECGGRAFNIGPHQDLTVDDMKIGCYDAGAFITGKTTSKAFGHFCIMDNTHKWKILVGTEVIRLIGP